MSGEAELGERNRGLFILSADDRDGLTALARETGWQPIAARRTAGAVQRYLASDALIALADMRGNARTETVIAPLAPAVEANGGALICVVEADRLDRVPALLEAGATHYVTAPLTAEQLGVALLSARRLTEIIGGGASQARRTDGIRRSDALFWRFDAASGLAEMSDGLRLALGLEHHRAQPATLLRHLPRADRMPAITCLRTVLHGARPAAFAHAVPDRPGIRMVHHLRPADDGMECDVEWLGSGQGRETVRRDYLTGLVSRQGALAWMEEKLADQARPVTILLLSISQFDRMNAAYGQMAGDALLGRVARRIERMVEDVVGHGPVVARIAGTEFLIGLAGEAGGAERAIFLARRLIGAIARPFSAGDHLIRLTARCGIAEARPDDEAAPLLRRAATALADAKQSDGEGIRILEADQRSREVDADQLETDLRLALDRGEIGIVFQPQYPMAEDRISGVEALARWNHPRYGALGAGILFAAAERSDYLLPLSAHIQARALREAAAWPAPLADLRLSVNVTAADIAQPDFLTHFLALVDGAGFPRARLTVEITESGLIEDVDSAITLLLALREAGLAVAIDDFGTGYSSLAYLKNLPLDYLKIDSGLAQDIAGSARDRIIVRGVIHMAKSLGLQVIAEGVETEAQRELLAREGCDYYQGFLRSAGIGSDDLAVLVLSME